jgi:hypothetical protein
MSAPRILFFVHSLTIGGAERLVIQLADALSAEYRIGICCLDSRGALWEECKQKGYTLYELQRQPGWQISTFLAAKRVVAEFAPTIIHAHQLHAVSLQRDRQTPRPFCGEDCFHGARQTFSGYRFS